MSNEINRRTLLARMWAGGGALLAAAGAWTSWDLLRPLASSGFGGRIRTLPAEAITEGVVVEVLAARSYLTRIDGEIVALSEKCTHLGCRTPFCESSGRFECPCHGSVFSRGGDYLSGPSPRGLDRYVVDEEDGLVYIDTGNKVEGAPPGSLVVDEPALGPACAGEAHA